MLWRSVRHRGTCTGQLCLIPHAVPFLNVYLLFSSFIKLSWRECNYFCKYREDYLELILSLHICLYMLMVIVYEVIHFLIIL